MGKKCNKGTCGQGYRREWGGRTLREAPSGRRILNSHLAGMIPGELEGRSGKSEEASELRRCARVKPQPECACSHVSVFCSQRSTGCTEPRGRWEAVPVLGIKICSGR